jgi:nicotinamide-nucleotide amidase
VRLTVKAVDLETATARLDSEETILRSMLGDLVFGVDDETMEFAIGTLLQRANLQLATAESFTGGLISARVVAVPGASRWFRGGVVSYASEVKFSLLKVDEGPVVSADAAAQMAEGVRQLLGAEVGLATTGVAGPDPQDGLPPGTAFVGIALPGETATGQELTLIGSRNRMRDIATISSLDVLRRRLLAFRE